MYDIILTSVRSEGVVLDEVGVDREAIRCSAYNASGCDGRDPEAGSAIKESCREGISYQEGASRTTNKEVRKRFLGCRSP